jgi:hypothetical protein
MQKWAKRREEFDRLKKLGLSYREIGAMQRPQISGQAVRQSLTRPKIIEEQT